MNKILREKYIESIMKDRYSDDNPKYEHKNRAYLQNLSDDELLRMSTEDFDEDDSNPIDKIDWTELRNQKTTLLNVIDGLEKLGVNTDDLQGLLATIDSQQDYAVDVLGIDGNLVFDFELEDCEASTPEEIFCRNSARQVFDMLCESGGFHQDADMPSVFIAGIMAQPKHGDIIKSMIAEEMLDDLKVTPEAFQYTGANQNVPVYDNNMVEDYGDIAQKYCLEKFNIDRTKIVFKCLHCNSDNVKIATWSNPNEGMKFVEIANENVLGYCNDCELPSTIESEEINYNKKVIGFQVVGQNDTPQEAEMHPLMKANSVYNLRQAQAMLDNNKNGEQQWQLLTIWTGDVEKPTLMFNGNVR